MEIALQTQTGALSLPYFGSAESELTDRTMVLGCYLLEQTLGKGSYGMVKLATDVRTNTKVIVLQCVYKNT